MKNIILLINILGFLSVGLAQNAADIVRKAYFNTQGNSQYAQIQMQIIRPKWTRTLEFKFASQGTDKALVLITQPEKEKGQTYLMVDGKMWMYNPKIKTLVKIGHSMLSQGWMGSDYSNNELMNQGSIITDYMPKIIGSETVEGRDCWKIELTPKEGANEVWGKQLLWIDKKDYLILKTQLFDEDGYLVRTQLAKNIKNMHGRVIPVTYEIVSEDDPDNKTIINIIDIKYDVHIPPDFFTVENAKKSMNINFDFR